MKKLVLSYKFILLLVVAPFYFLSSQEQITSKKIYLSEFSAYKGKTSSELVQKIYKSIENKLKARGFEIIKAPTSSINSKLTAAKENKAKLLIDGFYKISEEDESLSVYVQMYDPQKGVMIDALNITNEIPELEGVKLDPKETQKTYEEIISELESKLDVRIRTNPKNIERRENINDYAISTGLVQEKALPVQAEDISKATEEVFKILAEREVEVVTASRKAQKISEAPSKVIVITKEMIEERGYRTLTELLQDIPGFDFNSFYDSGEYPTDMILRGISDVGQTQILIMENGIIQNDIGNGWIRHVQFDTLFIDVERIEIILGPGSSLYGANAYAGLINIITKKGKNLFKDNTSLTGKIKLQGGKYRTYFSEGLFAYKFPNDMIFQFAGRYYHTNGDRGLGRPDPANYFSNNYEPLTVQTSEFGVVQNDKIFGTTKKIPDGFDNSAKDFFVRSSLSKNGFTLGFNLWDLQEGLGTYVPAYEYFANTKGIPYRKHHRGFYVYASYETEITNKLSSTTKIYYRNTTILPDTGFVYTYRYQSIDNPISSSGRILPPVWDKAKQYHGPSYLMGGQQQFNYEILPTNNLVFGVQVDRFIRQSISDGVGGVSLGKKQSTSSNIVESTWENQKQSVATVFYSSTIAGYIQDEQKFWKDKLSITLGVRYDKDSDYGKIWTKRAALIVKPFTYYNAKILYGEAFKAPTVFQLYDEFRGNRNLEPQKIKTSEIENNFLPFKNFSFKVGYFMSQLRGLIAEGKNPDPNAPATRTTIFQNFKPTHIYGYILELDYNINNFMKIFTNYTLTRDRDIKTLFNFNTDQRGRIIGISPIYDGKEIDNIAERKANLGVHFNFTQDISLNLRLNWVGKRKAPITNKYFQPYDFEFIQKKYPYQIEGKPDGYMSGYTLVNANFSIKNLLKIKGLELQVLVRNLLNKAYSGMGRQSGNAIRPIDEWQTRIRNPDGFVSPYHPQPRREIFLQVSYEF